MKLLLTILSAVFLFACSPKTVDLFPEDEGIYNQEIIQWQNKRNKDIKSPKGWLSVVGLYWLQEGRNKIGSSPDSDIVFPEFAANKVGDLYLERGELYFRAFEESYIEKNGKGFREGTMFSDARRAPTELSHKSLYFHVIRRGTQFGLRVKNTLEEKRFKFEGLKYFETDTKYKITGTVGPSHEADSILINDIAGIQTMYKIEDILTFKFEGKEHELIAFDGGKDKYFVIFSDKTNNKQTYGGGRFLYVNKPKSGSSYVKIDFNKAFNPPCAFTDFATCPIPPPQNHLNFSVMAGEKKVDIH